MAEGFFRSFDPYLKVYSAGTQPMKAIHPMAIEVMQEDFINISNKRTKHVNDYLHESFDYVITLNHDANKPYPIFSGVIKNKIHMDFDDPDEAKGSDDEIRIVYRRIRDEIKNNLFKFCKQISEQKDEKYG